MGQRRRGLVITRRAGTWYIDVKAILLPQSFGFRHLQAVYRPVVAIDCITHRRSEVVIQPDRVFFLLEVEIQHDHGEPASSDLIKKVLI